MGKEVGLTSPAVAERVNKLENSGVILGYKPIIDYHKLGFQLRAIITLRAFVGKTETVFSQCKHV